MVRAKLPCAQENHKKVRQSVIPGGTPVLDLLGNDIKKLKLKLIKAQ